MIVYELVILNRELLRTLESEGVRVGDYKLIPLIEEYTKMKDDKHKTTFIVAHLSAKYKISERSIYEIIKRLNKECKVSAAEIPMSA